MDHRNFPVGTNVVFPHPTDRYPHFVIPAGTTGHVSVSDEQGVWVKVHQPVEGLTGSEWKGEFHWSADDWSSDPEAPFKRTDHETYDVTLATVAGPDVGGSPGSRVAKGHVLVHVDGKPVVMTVRGWDLLCRIADDKVFHISGATVSVARKLADGGLVRLQDDGPGPMDRGRVDGERWSVTLTALGQCVASVRSSPSPTPSRWTAADEQAITGRKWQA